MTAETEEGTRLSADEVESLAGPGAGGPTGVPFARASGGVDDSGYLRSLELMADQHSRMLSTLYQAMIRVSLLPEEPTTNEAFVEACEAEERVTLIGFAGSRAKAYLRFERPLFYAWLNRAFGARASVPVVIPERPVSRVEERFLLRISSEWAQQLASAAREWKPLEMRIESTASPEKLASAPPQGAMRHAKFLMEGFAETGHIHCLFPAELVGAAPDLPGDEDSATYSGVQALVRQTPIELRAQLATGTISLSQIARLRRGDVLPLDGGRDGGVVVFVGGCPKFTGVPGAVGGQRAVRISGRVSAE